MAQNPAIRVEMVQIARSFSATGLSVGKSGNLSVLTDSGFVITPSGVPYEKIGPEDLPELDMEGNIIRGELKPSSEWQIHRDIYISRVEVNAVIHTHSPYATAIACTRQAIPAFHYMIAIAGGNSIRCADYATFGTAALSRNALAALQGRNACLLANHGMLALGKDLHSAFELAQHVEELARQYWLSRQLGEPVILDDEEMAVNLEKFKSYGKESH